MNKITLTKSQARKIILHAAGLSRRSQFGKGKEAVWKLINHLGFVQVDTNYVVERAHHHAIACRVPEYEPEWLDELQDERTIFEFWTYASGFIPIADFRFSLPIKASFLARRKPLSNTEFNMMQKVLNRIGREGPLMARDFENDRVTKSTGWWDWRPSKVALERLLFEGKLMTTRKPGFQKVCDLPDNVLPREIDRTMPAPEEFAQHVIMRSLKALGVAGLKDISFRGRWVKKNPVKAELEKLADNGAVCRVEVEGMKGTPLYMLPEYRKMKIKLGGDAFILSPFDVVNVYRQRLKDFFDFDYMVECFVPRPKRKYGYFSLPVLIGDRFVARMDSKADRKLKKLIIYNLHVEPVKLSSAELTKLRRAIEDFATFNKCDKIEIEKSNKRGLSLTFDVSD